VSFWKAVSISSGPTQENKMKNYGCLNVIVYIKEQSSAEYVCVVGKCEGRRFNIKHGSWAQQKAKP